jgi:hypothetical protein
LCMCLRKKAFRRAFWILRWRHCFQNIERRWWSLLQLLRDNCVWFCCSDQELVEPTIIGLPSFRTVHRATVRTTFDWSNLGIEISSRKNCALRQHADQANSAGWHPASKKLPTVSCPIFS